MKRNPFLLVLIGVGAVAVLVGGIGAMASKDAAEREARINRMVDDMLGGRFGELAPDYTTTLVFVGVAVLGVLMLVAALVVLAVARAASPTTAAGSSADRL